MDKSKECECKECIIKSLFFSNLNIDEFKSICSSKIQKEFKKGEIIIEQGQSLDFLIYLKSGLVKYYIKLHDGRTYIINISVPFDDFPLLTVFNETHLARYSMAAIEDSVLCYIPLNLIREFIMKNGNFAFDFISKLNYISCKIINNFILIRSKNLRGRVAFFLLNLAKTIYNGKNVFELPLSRKEIGELIGMTTENVIRAFSEFRKEKIIRINGKEIEILEKEKLEKISIYG
jgi:CRP/FNR family transcriptional regulator